MSFLDSTPALPTLEAERVRLRALRDDDVSGLFEVFSDPEVVRYTTRAAHGSLDDTGALVREIQSSFEARSLFQWGIAERTTDEVVGTVTLMNWSRPHGRLEVGYTLARAMWGRGLAREALARILNFGFDVLELRRVEADVDPRNERSLALLTRLGFRREGLLRERYKVGGELQDTVMLGLLRREWRA